MTMNELLNQKDSKEPASHLDNKTVNLKRITADFGEETKSRLPSTPQLHPGEFNYDTPTEDDYDDAARIETHESMAHG